jgi:hypothetical protein
MAWRFSIGRAIMSATGLLYIALGAVLAGEVLARGRLFGSAVPVWRLVASTCEQGGGHEPRRGLGSALRVHQER